MEILMLVQAAPWLYVLGWIAVVRRHLRRRN